MNPFLAIPETRRVPVFAVALLAFFITLWAVREANSRASAASGGTIARPLDLLTASPGSDEPSAEARRWLVVSLVVDFVFLTSLALVDGLASVWAAVYRIPWLAPLSAPMAWLICVAALIDVGENLAFLWMAALWRHASWVPSELTCFAFFCSRAKFVALVGLSYAILVGVARLRTVL